jgi:hypothetical protein
MLKIEKTSGLYDESPLQGWLREVDELVKYKQSWAEIHQHLSVENIYAGFLACLGHPNKCPAVDEDQVRQYAAWLYDNEEPDFADILTGLRLKGLKPKYIRLTMMFILVNLEYLKHREAEEGKLRSIDDGWLDE